MTSDVRLEGYYVAAKSSRCAPPTSVLFVSDGKDAWFYLPGDGQVRKAPVRKLDDLRSPLRLLLGKTRLEKEIAKVEADIKRVDIKLNNPEFVRKAPEEIIVLDEMPLTATGNVDRTSLKQMAEQTSPRAPITAGTR